MNPTYAITIKNNNCHFTNFVKFFIGQSHLATVGHFRKFPALENFSCWKFTRWKSVAGNAGKMEKF